MGNENRVVANQVINSSDKNEIKDANEEKYSIYNYIKSHPGALALIFSSMVAVITFFAQVTAFINNKNTLEYWNIDNSYASWDDAELLYAALTSVVYVIVVSLLVTWFSKICDAYFEQKKLIVTCKLIRRQHRKDYNAYKKVILSITSLGSISADELREMKDHLKVQKENLGKMKVYTRKMEYHAKMAFFVNFLPNIFVFVLLAVIRNFITSPKKGLLISSIVIVAVQLIIYWLSFLMLQSITIKKKQIKECIKKITPEELEELSDFKKEYPLLSLLKREIKISNISFVSLVVQTFIVCTLLVFSLVLLGGSEASKNTFQIVNIDNQQFVVVFHEAETYYLEKAIIVGDKLEVYTDEQRIIMTSDISFSIKTFDEVVKKQSTNPE